MQLQLSALFFTFSLGTRTYYFGRTILHGGAGYKATGRGFVVHHIKFAENYRVYSRSHFVKALDITLLLVVYIAYGYTDNGASSFVLTLSSWVFVISWLFSLYIFNPSGFEWQNVELSGLLRTLMIGLAGFFTKEALVLKGIKAGNLGGRRNSETSAMIMES